MIDFTLQVLIMAGLGRDRTVGQVESAESSARQFGEQSEIRETKANETENILKRHSLHPNKIYTHLVDIDKGEIQLLRSSIDIIILYNQYSCTISTFLPIV